jgi:hypothetical protein
MSSGAGEGHAGYLPAFACAAVPESSFQFSIVLEAEVTEAGRDPVRMKGYDDTGIKVRGINEFAKSVVGSGVQHSCRVKQSVKSKQ